MMCVCGQCKCLHMMCVSICVRGRVGIEGEGERDGERVRAVDNFNSCCKSHICLQAHSQTLRRGSAILYHALASVIKS